LGWAEKELAHRRKKGQSEGVMGAETALDRGTVAKGSWTSVSNLLRETRQLIF